MEFFTQYNRPPRKSETFDKTTQEVWKKRTNTKTGKKELYVEKEIDIYEKIQEYKDEVSITNLMQQHALDPLKQLHSQEERIIDLTNVPENLMEMMNEIEKADQIWNKLSKETKSQFENDKNVFLAASENGRLAQMLQEELKTSAEKFNVQAPVQNTNTIPGQVSVEQYQQMVQPTTGQTPIQNPTQTINNGGTL